MRDPQVKLPPDVGVCNWPLRIYAYIRIRGPLEEEWKEKRKEKSKKTRRIKGYYAQTRDRIVEEETQKRDKEKHQREREKDEEKAGEKKQTWIKRRSTGEYNKREPRGEWVAEETQKKEQFNLESEEK